MRIVWSDLAQNSLLDIASYISKWFSPKIAQRSILGIREAVHGLADMPCKGRPIEHLSPFGNIRCITYKQNRIYYNVLPDEIEIIMVWDGRQDPEVLKRLMLNHYFMVNNNIITDKQ